MKSLRLILVFAVVAAVLAMAMPGQSAKAQDGLSPGCTLLNEPGLDGTYYGNEVQGPLEFWAGEIIMVTTGTPRDPFATPFGMALDYIGAAWLRTGSAPGSIFYIIPSDMTVPAVSWNFEDNVGPMDVSCAAPTAVPGCDLLFSIPEWAAGGLFVADAMAYWAPGKLTDPLETIGAGNTAWVLGMDSSGEYYQFIWVCDLLWTTVDNLAPNPDEVWNSTPLPTEVVE